MVTPPCTTSWIRPCYIYVTKIQHITDNLMYMWLTRLLFIYSGSLHPKVKIINHSSLFAREFVGVIYVGDASCKNVAIEHEGDVIQTYQVMCPSCNGQCLLAKPFLDHWSWSIPEISC